MKRYKYFAAVLSLTLLVTACGATSGTSADANPSPNADTNGGASGTSADANPNPNADTNMDSAAVDGGNADNKNNKNDTSVSIASDSKGAFTGTIIDTANLFSKRDLSGEYDASKCEKIMLSGTGASSDSKGVTIDGSTVTITKEGDYLISGTLRDGMIIVDVDKTEKVQLILNGVDINSADSAAIYVKKADKVFVTLAEGTENTLANGGNFVAVDDNNIDAVIFSKDDLTLNGTGSLTITSPAGHGIVCKDELVITNGSYDITAASHGISGKDSVAVADGSFAIKAGKDGIRSANDEDDAAGYVYIGGGSFALNVESDGISAVNEISMENGTIVIGQSYEGLEARIINISGGELDLTASDDGLNATDKRTSAAASDTANINTANKGTSGRNADAAKDTSGGNANAADAASGGNADAAKDTSGGNTTAAGDTSGGNANTADKSFRKGFGGGGMGGNQSDANINISGGIVRINAEGDGIDSNGYLTMSGGEVYVAGPSNSGNAALDYGIDASISGGVIVAAGQSGMAQNFGSDSTQGAILVNTQQQNAAGSSIVLLDSSNQELVAWSMKKSYNSVVVSCPGIVDGGSYILKTGGTDTAVTMEGLIYGGGFGGGMHGGFDKHGDENGMKKPDFGNGEVPPDFKNGKRPEGTETPPDFKKGNRGTGNQENGNQPAEEIKGI